MPDACQRPGSFGLSRVWGLTSLVIEQLFDGVTVICCLGLGLLFAAAARPNAGLLFNLLVTGAVLFGTILLAAVYHHTPYCETISRIIGSHRDGAARVRNPSHLADIEGHCDYSHHLHTGCVLVMVSR
jgi:hypothetical protein